MRDYFPDLFASFGRDTAVADHDDWLAQDDPFHPLPVQDRMGMQLPDQPPPADDIILSDDELKLMLPMLLYDQGHHGLKEDSTLKYVRAVKNYTPGISSPRPIGENAVAPKNTRKERPAKRPLDDSSVCLRSERSLKISTLNSSEDLNQVQADRKGLKKRIKNYDASDSGTPSQMGRLQEVSLLSDFLARQDGAYVNTAPSKNKNPIPDPLIYDVLQSYKTLNDPSNMSTEQNKRQSNINTPLPQWHWHDASESMDVPSPRVVTRNDSNGIPQTYKIVYAAITMPYAVANKFDPVALYKTAKGAIESLINHDNSVVNAIH